MVTIALGRAHKTPLPLAESVRVGHILVGEYEKSRSRHHLPPVLMGCPLAEL